MKKITLLLFALTSISLAQADDYTVELYNLYCKACHGVKGSGAPLAFSSEWKPYLKLGTDTLVNNAITGIRNMPAMGTCSECEVEDLEDLITYMSQEEK